MWFLPVDEKPQVVKEEACVERALQLFLFDMVSHDVVHISGCILSF